MRECIEFDTFDSAKEVTAHAFEHLDNILLFNETHFAVDLRKLRLTVGTKVFVAETFHDLEVAVETTHHQQLFESLRRLRKCVELALVHTAWHYEVARTFRSRFDEHRSFYFDEAFSIEVTTHFERHFVTKFEVSTHRVTTEVEVAILHTDVVATISFVLDSERRSSRHIEHSHLIYNDFDVASSHFIIFSRAFSHSTTHLEHIFATKVVSTFTEFGIHFVIKYKLSKTIAVAEVDKSHTTHFTSALHPTSESNILAKISEAKFATCVSSKHNFGI